METDYGVFVVNNVLKLVHDKDCACSEHEIYLERCIPNRQQEAPRVYMVDRDIYTDIIMIEFFYAGGFVQDFYNQNFFNNMMNKRVVESYNQSYRIIQPKIKFGQNTQEICLKILDGFADRHSYFLFFKTKCKLVARYVL
jgi:hypothetical protein